MIDTKPDCTPANKRDVAPSSTVDGTADPVERTALLALAMKLEDEAPRTLSENDDGRRSLSTQEILEKYPNIESALDDPKIALHPTVTDALKDMDSFKILWDEM